MDDPLEQHWRQQALCRGHKRPELWDQSVGENERRESRNARHEQAMRVCNSGGPGGAPCPVRAECRAAVDPLRDEGVRGGVVLRAIKFPAGYGDVQGVARAKKNLGKSA